MLHQTVSHAVELRYILKAKDGLFFSANPANPILSRHRSDAREFELEQLAEDFRQFVEMSAHRSFEVFMVVGGGR